MSQTAFDILDERGKVAVLASFQAQSQDRSLQNFSTLATASKFFSTDQIRTNFKVDGTQQSQQSDLSSDTLAVFTSRKQNVMAFRGTDNQDPLRYLGFIPDDQESKILALNPDFESLPFEDSESCGCNATSQCAVGPFRNTYLKQVSESYCEINVFRSEIPRKKGIGYNSISEMQFTQDFQKSTLALEAGGGLASQDSDCASDILIARAAAGGQYETFRNDDLKHKYSRMHALDVYRFFRGKPWILCGHSLGGSLAMNAFIGLTENEEVVTKEEIYYVGFNAAILANFNVPLQRLCDQNPQWQNQAIHFRSYLDFVSQGAGSGLGLYVPTVAFRNDSDTTYYTNVVNRQRKGKEPWVHGLQIFFSCPSHIESVRHQEQKFAFSRRRNVRLVDDSTDFALAPILLWIVPRKQSTSRRSSRRTSAMSRR